MKVSCEPEACIGVEAIAQGARMIRDLSNLDRNATFVDKVNRVNKFTFDLVHEFRKCYRHSDMQENTWGTLGKIGILFYGRNDCENSFALALMLWDMFKTHYQAEKEWTDKLTLEVLLMSDNLFVNFGDCKEEITTITNFWFDRNEDTPSFLSDGEMFFCLGEHYVTNLLPKIMARNRVDGYEMLRDILFNIPEHFIDCERTRVMKGNSKGYSLIGKVGWTISNRSRCEKTFGALLVMIDKIAQVNSEIGDKLFLAVLSLQQVYVGYFDCKSELDYIYKILKK